jgi:hypothetical protein
MTCNTQQSYESIILKRKFPNKPTKWNRIHYTMIILNMLIFILLNYCKLLGLYLILNIIILLISNKIIKINYCKDILNLF